MAATGMTERIGSDGDSRRGVIIAFGACGCVLLAVTMFANKVRTAPPPVIPGIFADPATMTVTNPAAVRFVTRAELRVEGGMWSAGDLHPHALVDTVMTMPMSSDISRVAADTFLLHLPRLDAGTHTVRIFWANGAHMPVGDSAVIRLVVH